MFGEGDELEEGDKFGRDMYLGRKLNSEREMGWGVGWVGIGAGDGYGNGDGLARENGWRARWIGLADELGEGDIKIVATRCHTLRLKCTKFDFGEPQMLLGELTVLHQSL